MSVRVRMDVAQETALGTPVEIKGTEVSSVFKDNSRTYYLLEVDWVTECSIAFVGESVEDLQRFVGRMQAEVDALALALVEKGESHGA